MGDLTAGLEKATFNNQGYLVTNLGARKYIYHVSANKSITELAPRTDTYYEKHASGGKKTKYNRVCFGDTIHGCVMALCLPNYNTGFVDDLPAHLKKAKISDKEYHLWLYQCDTTDLSPSNIQLTEDDDDRNYLDIVFDRYITGEIGYFGTAPVTRVGKLIVNMRTKSRHMKDKYKQVVFAMPGYQDNLDSSTVPLAPFDLEIAELDADTIHRDREELYTRYLLYHAYMQKNLILHQRNIKHYLATDKLLC